MTGKTLSGDRLEQEIRKLLDQGNNRTKISELTGIPQRTVDTHIHNIHEADKEMWREISLESLENRALLIKQKYERLSQITEQLMEDESKTPYARIEAGKTMIACQLNIYNMIKAGPLKFKTIPVKELEDKPDE